MGETRVVRNEELAAEDALVGAKGGRAQIVGGSADIVFGALAVETEHGMLYLGPDEESIVPARFVTSVRVVTFKDVNVEALPEKDL